MCRTNNIQFIYIEIWLSVLWYSYYKCREAAVPTKVQSKWNKLARNHRTKQIARVNFVFFLSRDCFFLFQFLHIHGAVQ